ncbi:MAG: cysteine--tRNA ligase [Candidatus Babeliales bacterium]
MLKITNTLTGKKEVFVPLEPNQVKMYVCGITPYDYAHIGHGRVYVTFDVLLRLLKFLDYNVTYCRNFTDIDDKLLVRAENKFGDQLRYVEIATQFIDAFHQDVDVLNCLPPTYEPRVTENIDVIIDFVDNLAKKKIAYVVDGDVYFSVEKFSGYPKLSKHKLSELRAGARVQVQEKKRDPLDFALWKSEPEGTFWKSPWGYGRPGWHIECSALAKKYLGEQIDIHGGGMDLIFPHHDNEIAQTEGLTEKPFARYWMHNAFVRVNKEKMSKSLGNFFTLQDVFKQFDPMVVRFYYLNHYYRAPLDFSFQDLEVAQKTYQKLVRFFEKHSCHEPLSYDVIRNQPIIKNMLDFLTDDLNTPGMFGVLFSNLDALEADEIAFCAVKQFLQQILGLTLEPLFEKAVEITPKIQKLIDAREQAREQKDWARADQIRDQLHAMGIELKDEKIK